MSIDYEDCLKKGKIRSFSRGKGLADKELQAASADLERAQKTFKDNDYKWATVQLYYSMFHSARALLYCKNLREHSHFCLIAAIQTLYVETKHFPVTLLEALKKAKSLREDADYYDRWSEEGCRKLLSAGEDFLDRAKQIISNQKSQVE
jgi:uncharacterized protein (UPF0332 family)